MTKITALDHVAHSVADLDASKAWYRKHFGFEEVAAWSGEGYRAAIIAAGPARPEMFEVSGATAGADETHDVLTSFRQRGLKHIGFAVDDVDAAFEQLRSEGAEVLAEPTTNEDVGMRIAFFRDCDGVQVELSRKL